MVVFYKLQRYKNSLLYCILVVIVGVMDTCFSILIRMDSAQHGNQIFGGNHQLYNVLITTHVFLMIFFMIMHEGLFLQGVHFLSIA